MRPRGFIGVTNPFLLTDASGVRYCDNRVPDGGHLLVMLDNADWISRKQIRPARVKNGEIGANEFPDPKDKWSPRSTPLAFETIIPGTTEGLRQMLVTVLLESEFLYRFEFGAGNPDSRWEEDALPPRGNLCGFLHIG